MADVLVNALTQITKPTSVDSFVMVDRTTNEGELLDATAFSRTILEVDCGTVSSLPKTVNSTEITEDMVVVESVLGTPARMAGNWTVSTSNGSVTISGSISGGSTTLKLYLGRRKTS